MTLKIAGGCGEHGRNCFYADAGGISFLVDCGIMAGSDDNFPRLSREEVQGLSYVFLTHSHLDHTGAVPWLYKNAFGGWIIASSCTLEQLPFQVRKAVPIEPWCKNNTADFGGISFEYGRAGHCEGSIWYHLCTADGSALFSGDYSEHSAVYSCDKIRDRSADIAVLDCAYGSDVRDFGECCDEIIDTISLLKNRYDTLIFPVPKYGRGIELLKLFRERLHEYICCGDKHFTEQLRGVFERRYWYKETAFSVFPYEADRHCDILFLSDPQLRSDKARETAERIIQNGGCGVMTGTAERGSFSEKLIQLGIMRLLRYPVHQNIKECEELAEKNDFRKVIPYHSAEFSFTQNI